MPLSLRPIFPAKPDRRLRYGGGFTLLLLAILLLAAVGLRQTDLATNAHSEPHQTLQSYDSARQILFLAQKDGSVRVLNLRNTVSEIGVLRTPGRGPVQALQLSKDGRRLLVQGQQASDVYDTHTLRLQARNNETKLASHSSMPSADAEKLLR